MGFGSRRFVAEHVCFEDAGCHDFVGVIHVELTTSTESYGCALG